MIKFFRTIRQKLVSENKFSKYLIYAIGEIILVMIGILLALQVNNWNVERKRGLKTKELSDNLLQELKGVKHLLGNQLQNVENQQNLIQYVINTNEIQMDSVLSLSKPGSFQIDPINFIFSYISYFDPRENIFNSAINEGTLTLIESNEIIKNLSIVYTMSENRWLEHVKAERSINTKIQEYISDEYQDMFNAGELINNKGAWDESTTNKILKKINTDGKLRYLLSAKLQILQFKMATAKKRVYPKLEESIEYFENRQK